MGETELRGEESRSIGEEFAARLDRGGLKHLRILVRGRQWSFHDGPSPAAQRGEGAGDMVRRGEGDEHEVDVRIIEHVLHATVHMHVRVVFLDDVAAFLHKVADCHETVKSRKRLERGDVVEKRCAPQPRDAETDGRPLRHDFVICFHRRSPKNDVPCFGG